MADENQDAVYGLSAADVAKIRALFGSVETAERSSSMFPSQKANGHLSGVRRVKYTGTWAKDTTKAVELASGEKLTAKNYSGDVTAPAQVGVTTFVPNCTIGWTGIEWVLLPDVAPASVKLVKNSAATWAKNTSATLPVYKADGSATGESITIINLFGDVGPGKWAIASTVDGGSYVLVDSERDTVDFIWKITEGVNKLIFSKRRAWVHTITDLPDDFIATTDCTVPYTPKDGEEEGGE